jgi:hypothetical protein
MWWWGLLVPGAVLLLWSLKRLIGQEIGPLATDLRNHMAQEAADSAELRLQLEGIRGDFKVNTAEHHAFDARLKRIEDKG